MGDNSDDFRPEPDLEFVGTTFTLISVQPWCYRANQVDTQAPHAATGTALAALHGAPSLAIFNTAMTNEYPNWWPALESRWGLGMYLAVTGQPG